MKLLPALAALVLAPAVLAAQSTPADTLSDLLLRVYHGGAGFSSVITFEADNGVVPTSKTRLKYVRPAGSEVCVRVENVHPVLYTYNLSTKIDTVKPSLPDVSALIGPLSDALGTANSAASKSAVQAAIAKRNDAQTGVTAVPKGGAGAPAALAKLDAANAELMALWPERFAWGLDGLREDLDSARAAIVRSDAPEDIADLRRSPHELRAGFRHAQDAIARLSRNALRFNDPKLAQNLDTLYASAQKDAKAESPMKETMLQALRGYSDALLRIRNDIRAGYDGKVRSYQQSCATVGQNVTHMFLNVARRDTVTATARDTGAVLRLDLIPRFPRATIELVPVAFGVFASDIPEFTVVNDTVRSSRSDASRLRAGTVLLANFSNNYLADGSVSLGAGLVFGLGGEGKVLSDLGGVVMLSYRDLFRVGIGTGGSELPDNLKNGLQPGQPVPKDLGDINKLVGTRRRRGTFLLFSISGLSLPVVK